MNSLNERGRKRRLSGSRLFVFTAFAVAVVLGSARAVEACSCYPVGPPCQEYPSTPSVFAGTPLRVTDIEFKVDGRTVRKRLVRFAVQEAFKGVSGNEIDVVTGAWGGDCGYDFKVGNRYLVYAVPITNDGRLATSICTRTALLAEAEEDIAFIRGFSGAREGGTLFGSATRYAMNLKSGSREVVGPIAGVRVVANSPDSWVETVTGDDGVFRFEGLRPGRYRVEATLPVGLTPQDVQEVEIADRGCAEVIYVAVADGRVSGRLESSDGKPVPTALDLIPVEQLDSDRRGLWAFPNNDGTFEFVDVPPGRYVLGVNLNRPSETKDEYPVQRTFFPIGSDAATARVIVVGDGQRVVGLKFRLPPPLVVRPILGKVVWPDGKPVAKAEVTIKDAEAGHWVSWRVETDAQGRFTIAGFDSRDHVLEATVPDDPNWQSDSGESVELLVAKPVRVTNTASLGAVRLVIQAPDGVRRTRKTVGTSRP